MSALISIQNVTFAYWKHELPVSPKERTVDDLNIVFDNLSLELPSGMVSILGENGIGKSSLLLLAGARLFPQQGRVLIDGHETHRFYNAPNEPELEDERNRLVSFVFQNMEFESHDTLGDLLEQVQSGNPNFARDAGIFSELTRALDIKSVLHRKTQELSKGELQRSVLALAISYGSRILMLDEPVFALEERHKQMTFEYLREVSTSTDVSIYFSAHDIDMCRNYAKTMLLLFGDKTHLLGSPEKVCTRENLEAAYRVPLETLYQKQRLYRDMLIRKSR